MKLKYKYQKFQADAAKAVVDVFAGQPYLTPSYMMDKGDGTYQIGLEEDKNFTGWSAIIRSFLSSVTAQYWSIFKRYRELINLSLPIN